MSKWIGAALLSLSVAACATTRSHDAAVTPPAYVVAEIAVTDPTGYREYLAAISPVVAKFGGVYLARAGKARQVEGPEPNGRIVIIKFPSFAAARSFEEAPEYLAAASIRHRTATSRIFVVEGAAP